MATRPRGVYAPPPITASPMIAGYGGGVSPVSTIQATAPMQAQMTPAQALATYSAFRKEADPNAARRRAMAQTAADFSGPTTSGSITEGLIRMAQAALATRANRDSEMERMGDKADKYNTAQSEFDAGVAKDAAKAGEIGAEAGRYGAYGMVKPQPMEVGGRVVDAANNYRELYAPAPNPDELELKREALDLRRQQIAQTAALAGRRGDSGQQWRPATQQEQAAYGTQQPLLIDDRTGNVKPIPGAGGVMASAEQRGRLALALPNVVQAQVELDAIEAKSGNVFNKEWGARAAEAIPFDGGAAARTIGGENYQAYEQASRSFEASIMPIFSGSAVTESEAQRFVRANLPRIGDTPGTLARKSQNRQRIANGAAEIMGSPPPFPGVPSWTPSAAAQAAPAAQPGGAPIDSLLDKYAPK